MAPMGGVLVELVEATLVGSSHSCARFLVMLRQVEIQRVSILTAGWDTSMADPNPSWVLPNLPSYTKLWSFSVRKPCHGRHGGRWQQPATTMDRDKANSEQFPAQVLPHQPAWQRQILRGSLRRGGANGEWGTESVAGENGTGEYWFIDMFNCSMMVDNTVNHSDSQFTTDSDGQKIDQSW